MNQKGYTTIAIISLVAVFILIVVAVYYLFKPIFPSFPSPYPVGNLPVDETADWKIYQSAKYGFGVRYPSNWKPSGKPVSENYASFISEDGREELAVVVYSDTNQPSLDDFLKDLDNRRATSYGGGPVVNIIKQRSIKIDQHKAVQREIFFNSGGFPGMENYLFNFGIVYGLLFYSYRPENPEIMPEQLKLYNKIISTFKFFEL